MATTGLDDQVRALRDGRAFARPGMVCIAVRGADADRWLDDLVTAGVHLLREGDRVRSLLLSPTGHIRADFFVLRAGDGFVLAQPTDQPEPVDAILAPYVLSSDVEIERLAASPFLVAGAASFGLTLEPPPDGAVEVSPQAADALRVIAGTAVFPTDLDGASLPAEAGLDMPPVTDTAKGCFLGQESVARVRNLGHPTRVVLHLGATEPIETGEAVVDEAGAPAGVVTSGARDPGAGRWVVLARIGWDARASALRTSAGVRLDRL